MEEIRNLFEKAVDEIERLLNSKTVVGEPITVQGATLIPLVNVGFGFGVGTGQGDDPAKGRGRGGGTGGGGVKPVALVVIEESGVRVEPIKSGSTTVLETLADTIGKAAAAKSKENTD